MPIGIPCKTKVVTLIDDIEGTVMKRRVLTEPPELVGRELCRWEVRSFRVRSHHIDEGGIYHDSRNR